ncbi:hypothetical protein [Frondihabitans australicus]|uniref:hypothetical protein n=1 Tax=Frondihabitans australicus TaxID=386892 RepID=UPI000EAEF35D|nr:hypothetical protein [Frondihabitans australicus]
MDPRTLEKAVSPARFATYLSTYEGRHDLASRLYFWNIELTGALWGPIAVLEVCLRNALHDAMRKGRRDDWWNDRDVRLLQRERRGFDAAVSTLAARALSIRRRGRSSRLPASACGSG